MATYEPKADQRRPRLYGRPRNAAEVTYRLQYAAKTLLIAGLVSALYIPRFGGPALVGAAVLLSSAAFVRLHPGSRSAFTGLIASLAWVLWVGFWGITHVQVIGAGPALDAVSFFINAFPAIVTITAAVACASSVRRAASSASVGTHAA